MGESVRLKFQALSMSDDDAIPTVIRPGDELPPDFESKKLIIATPEHNAELLAQLSVLSS